MIRTLRGIIHYTVSFTFLMLYIFAIHFHQHPYRQISVEMDSSLSSQTR